MLTACYAGRNKTEEGTPYTVLTATRPPDPQERMHGVFTQYRTLAVFLREGFAALFGTRVQSSSVSFARALRGDAHPAGA